ncbi:hypothetical protein MRBLMC3_000805 [Sphingobium sp. LMC3-1-1.1]|uniref:hypothetical protein n=1 Tax=Sphingobium sp. LMC3-1-1.1 TaxID=3135241 RepID=UPI003418BCB2
MTDISDHAVIRYLERVKGVDIAALRAEMQSPALAVAEEFGCPVVIGKNGERLVVRNGVVVTVIAKARNVGRTIGR